MTSVDELLVQLERRKIVLWHEGDKLRFRAPSGAMTGELRAAIAGNKAAILARLQAQNGNGKIREEGLPRRSPEQATEAPLSFAQQRLWFLDQLEKGSAQYNECLAVRLEGPLRVDAIRAGLNAIIARHEILRTTFPTVEGVPVQRIGAPWKLQIPEIDLRQWPDATREAEIRRLLDDAATQSFDLAEGPLMRLQLLRTGEVAHILFVTMHHIISDNWSSGVFLREFQALYEAHVNETKAELGALPIQYADYAVWQRAAMTDAQRKDQLQYWREQLKDAPAVLELPTDRPRPLQRSYRGGIERLEIGPELLGRLLNIGRQSSATPFMTLLAAFALLLQRYSGARDLVIGTPIANRGQRELESLIGFLVNTLALRIRSEDRSSFRDVLAHVRRTCLDAYANPDLPFDHLVNALDKDRDLSVTPLFQVMFVLQNDAEYRLKLPGVELRPIHYKNPYAKFDLTLLLQQQKEGYRGFFEYNCDIFDAATIGRLKASFLRLLESIAAGPDLPVGHLQLLTEEESRYLLENLNATMAPPPSRSVHERFEARAAATPDADAIIHESGLLSYRELNEAANRVADVLRRRSIGVEDVVGLCTRRSPATIIGMLGILKAGAAYLPLDPSFPSERLVFQLKDAGARLVLTLAEYGELVSEAGLPILCFDRDRDLFEQEDAADRSLSLPAEALMYVIYTSGSTGRPKGVEVPHQGVLRLVCNSNYIDVAPDETFLLFSALSFDVSTFEIWAPLLNGARLAIMPPSAQGMEDIGRAIRDWNVTTLWLAAGLFHLMVDERPEELQPLRRLMAGGDVLSPPRVLRARDVIDGELINGYGPTESSTFSTTYQLAPDEDVNGSVPIGRPISHTTVYVLDSNLNLQPQAVSGELFIGGPGLARGYRGQAALTAERFLPNPYSKLPGGRMYRSGDLARVRIDGIIEFLGRRDFQVKIRGFRIETGEVEAVLAAHPAVHSAVVIARRDVRGEKVLAAYYTLVPQGGSHSATTKAGLRANGVAGPSNLASAAPGKTRLAQSPAESPSSGLANGHEAHETAGKAPSDKELREWLGQRLPAFMQPATFTALETWPLTSNGKLDRAALPDPAVLAKRRRPSALNHRSEYEEILAELWTELLQRPTIATDDDFFELGGHSLLATQLVSRIYRYFGIELPVRAVFEAPTLGELTQRLVADKDSEESVLPAIEAAERAGDGIPLSYSQQRLWFLHQMDPEAVVYNIPVAYRLEGPLNQTALQESLDAMLRRHEALRCRFADVDGRPVQVIQPEAACELEVLELDKTPDAAGPAELLFQQASRPFDLERGPLLRAVLFVGDRQDHFLLLTMHHIISDGWSHRIFLHELSILYNAFSAGEASPLGELSVQYADFALWQRRYLDTNYFAPHLAYWRQQLAGAAPLLELPVDRPRPAVQSFRGGLHRELLNLKLLNELKELGRSNGCTLFMTLLAAFKVLLMRYTGRHDIIVGTPIANRTRHEIEGLIGFFVNSLALRTDLSGDPAFRTLLERVRQTALGAYAHQDLPFERLVEELRPQRSTSHTPLFQVMFVLQNTQGDPPRMAGLSTSNYAFDATVAKFDLTLYIEEQKDGLSLAIEYNKDLFDAGRIARMAGHYLMLLRQISAEPDTKVSRLRLLTAAEQRQMMDWQRAESAGGTLQPLATTFDEQAALRPDAVALVLRDAAMSYRELQHAADRLAAALHARDLGPESRVGLYIDRSFELVIAILGIVKAGAAYVPLDPAYPSERLRFMASEAEVPLVLTRTSLLEQAPPFAAEILAIDELEEGDESAEDLSAAAIDNTAYIIFTSGSTGRPKAVPITQRHVARLFSASAKRFQFGAEDVWTLFHSYAFDFSVWEIWGALLHGGRLIIVPQEVSRDPERFYDLLLAEEVTVLNQTPSAFLQLLSVDREAKASSALALRFIIFGGEALNPVALADWFDRHPEERTTLVNMYGITETTVHVTAHNIRPEDCRRPASLIGRPLADLRVRILDADGMLVPSGIAGELHIGGAGLTTGYLGRPGLSAERFVPDPWAETPGARLYRSGDLGRYTADGAIEYLGRIDHQVKLRGFRIELGEIESQLCLHPQVREAVILMREFQENSFLVAYICLRAGGSTQAAELREFLAAKLPEFMLPAFYVILDEFPLASTGKVDRRALAALDFTGAIETSDGGLSTPAEEIVAGLFAEVLGRDTIGLRDNFFELGGHSLLATQLISRIRGVFAVELPLRSIFEWPSVAGIAACVDRRQNEKGHIVVPPIQAQRRGDHLPLSYSQQRLWFLREMEADSGAYNIPVAVRIDGPLRPALLEQVFGEIIRRHESLRTTIGTVDGKPVQIVKPPEALRIAVRNLQHHSAEEQDLAIRRRFAEEAEFVFDLERGPLLHFELFQLAADRHVFLVNMHHIVSDGWSMSVLIRELQQLYTAFAAGESSPLPDLRIGYADFAAWQRSAATADLFERQLAFWKQQLAAAPPLLELPTDRPRPAQQSYRGASLRFALGKELSAAMAALSRQTGCTRYMTLLAAFKLLLQRYSRQNDIVVGAPIANRNRAEIENLIGFFVNSLALRSNLSGNPTVKELLERVRTSTLDAYTNQDLPFEKLVEELQPQRSLSHSPLFQVMFVLQNAATATPSIPDLRFETLKMDSLTTKFDLTVYLLEGEDGLQGEFEYNSDLFDAATIERMSRHYLALLRAMTAEPQQRINELPMLSTDEYTALAASNGARTEHLTPFCLHELFEQQVLRKPDAPACSTEETSISYAELNSAANRVARRLQREGIGPETFVGLCTGRGPQMLYGLLGILKAGAAYVPLDPAYPAERLQFIIKDADIRVILTEGDLTDALPPSDAELILIEDIDEGEATGNPESAAQAQNAAYVIYTSGSTGQPKGVTVCHSNVTRLFAATEEWFRFDSSDIWTLFHSYAFDFSVWEIWGALLHGGRLLLISRELSRATEELYALLSGEGVTVLNQTPSAFYHLMRVEESMSAPLPLSLRLVIFGGEALNLAALKPWFERHGDEQPQLVNMYGITETSVHVTARPLRAADCELPGSMIGRAIPDLRLHILDEALHPVPPGVAGELFVGGAGVSRGYLHRPALTAERFVPEFFTSQAGARLYRTGDLARYRADGDIEYLGRADQQVQLRGFRIEPGEIEATLTRHPGVRECFVELREDTPGARRLVAYVVFDPGFLAGATELSDHLRRHLPDYMLPAAIVPLQAMPLTASGKIDRQAMPAPESLRQEDGAAMSVSPVTELLMAIFAEILELPGFGADENFFERGGHSLMVTQIVVRIRSAMSVAATVRHVFEYPSPRKLAMWIEGQRQEDRISDAPIQRRDSKSEAVLSFAQQRLWILAQIEGRSSSYNIPAALRIIGPLKVDALHHSLRAIVNRHEVLRTRYALQDGRPRPLIDPPGDFEMQQRDLGDLPDQEKLEAALALAAEEAALPFDFAKDRLIRASLLRMGEEAHVLLLTMHHIVADGWSLGIFIREINTNYQAFLDGNQAPLPDLPIQYTDVAAWQRELSADGVYASQADYWRRQLAGAPPLLELPTDRPRPARQTFVGATLTLPIGPELKEALQTLSRRQGATLFMTMLAGFKLLLARYSGLDDIVVGSPVANRSRPESEELIGFFVNTLLLRSDLGGNPRFCELLAAIRATALDAYANQDLPFEQLVEILQPPRSMSYAPLAQVMFALQNASRELLQLPGLKIDILDSGNASAKFDLSVLVSETTEGLRCSFEYNSDLFDEETIAGMMRHYHTLLGEIVAHPDARLAALSMLDETERHLVLRDWSCEPAPAVDGRSILDLFEEQVTAQAEAAALRSAAGTLSFAELDARVTALAQRLHRQSVGPETPVGVFAARSPALVIGMMAIMKAGGVYVPLDPAYPGRRLQMMLDDAGIELVLTTEEFKKAVPESDAAVIVLDAEGADAAGGKDRPFIRPTLHGASAAYIIFTSGSTGRPKGVIVTHDGLTNLLLHQRDVAGLGAGHRSLMFSSPSFDVSVMEVLLPLCSGATLHLTTSSDLLPARPLHTTLGRERISHTFLPPAALASLPHEALPELQTLFVGGEALPPELARRWQTMIPMLLNLYGPTEVTVCASLARCSSGDSSVSIGRPLRNLSAYVLDSWLQPTPAGVPGELYLGGIGLARAYVDSPGATADKFVPDPFSEEAGARMYRSGDRVRFRPDGAIEYLGRVDAQIKLRGFRIEPAEIESVLTAHPDVKTAIVQLHRDVAGDRELIAYLLPQTERTLDLNELTACMKRQLPTYMIPAILVPLDSLPLTPNGKLDRKALPAPRRRPAASRPGRDQPLNELQRSLMDAWCETLNIEAAGLDDNFFEIGGNSLKAVALLGIVEAKFGNTLQINDLFDNATLRRQAELIAARQTKSNGQGTAKAGPKNETAPTARRVKF